MSSEWILAVDQGTTNTKALLVDRDGQPAFRTSVGMMLHTPQPGWIEQDPSAIWSSVLAVIRDSICWATQHHGHIAGVSISNQRETVVAWDRGTSNPASPAILWQCGRSAGICERHRSDGHEAMLRRATGLGVDTLFSASKIQWLLEHIPGLRDKAAQGDICFGTVDSWLIWMLTRGARHVCDVSNAARTQLFNIGTLEWDRELLALFGIPHCTLPVTQPSSSRFGQCEGIDGLHGVPIVSALGDSHAAMAGHARFSPGTVKATYGTGSSLLSLLPQLPTMQEPMALTVTVAWQVEGYEAQYALEGNISMSGATVQWVGEFLGLTRPVEDTVALAASQSDTGGVFLVPAMAGLGAPYWESSARGNISGLCRTSRAAHLALAAVESIAFQVADVFYAMQREASCDLPELRADGGASRNDWLMQFQADLVRRPVVQSGHEDLSAIGAAWLGGIALGWWRSVADLHRLSSQTKTFSPGPLASSRAARYPEWRLAVQRALLSAVSQ